MIHRCKATYWTANGMPCATYEVLVDGEKYRCNEHQLDRLYDGVDPADLDLDNITDSDQDTEAFERAEAHWQHYRSQP